MKSRNWKFMLLVLAFAPLSAFAHARLRNATPAPNSVVTVDQPPAAISLEFSEDIEPAFSKVELRENLLQGPSAGEVKVSVSADKKNVLQVQLQHPLKPGRYFVLWKVTSVDTHKSSGNYAFTIK